MGYFCSERGQETLILKSSKIGFHIIVSWPYSRSEYQNVMSIL